MKADPTRQQRLLDLQELDSRVGQLQHRLASLPEHAQLADLTSRAEDAHVDLVQAQTAHDDVQRELTKAEADVQLVRDRAARDQQRLDAGTGSAKDLQGLQHELESLARRQATLEDAELEVMERAETLEAGVRGAQANHESLLGQIETVTAARDEQVAALEAEREAVLAGREELVEAVGADLVALYDKVRAHSGTGAAALVARRCTGCQLELNAADLARIRAAAQDEVLRCEECRRILVRTAESGV